MRIRIDFTLFSTPTDPFAIVQGTIEMSKEPGEGEAIVLEWPADVTDIDGRHFLQQVKWIIPGDRALGPVHALEDVVMTDRDSAQRLGDFWMQRYDLDVDTLAFDLTRARARPRDDRSGG